MTIFFNCGKEDRKKHLNSTEISEVLGPKEKGVFDSVNVPANLKIEIKKISLLNYFQTGESPSQNSDDHDSTPFYEFEKVKKKASYKELYQLTSNKNHVVSLYSYLAVAESTPLLTPIFYSRLLNVKRKLYSENACLIGDLQSSEIYYNEYLKKVDEDVVKTDKVLNKLDSISIMSDHTTAYVLNQALRHRIYPESFHNRIEYLAFRKRNPYVLLYLSKHFRNRYQDQLQKSIISYFKDMDSYTNQDFSRDALILELMRFKNPVNKNLIEKLLKNTSILESDPEVNHLKPANGLTK